MKLINTNDVKDDDYIMMYAVNDNYRSIIWGRITPDNHEINACRISELNNKTYTLEDDSIHEDIPLFPDDVIFLLDHDEVLSYILTCSV